MYLSNENGTISQEKCIWGMFSKVAVLENSAKIPWKKLLVESTFGKTTEWKHAN